MRTALEDFMEIVMIWLARHGARRPGYRNGVGRYSDWTYSEIGEARALIMTTRPRSVPLGEAPLGGMVYTDPVSLAGTSRHWTNRSRV
jgi:hypothetical protein